MDISKQISSKAESINERFEAFLPKEEGFQKVIFEAMNYSIRVGGKRLRPMMMEETYRLFGGTGKEIEPFMMAMECIHTYSLVHDDLPAMDNDEYRRGQLTTHAKFGEVIGILAGDALLNYAFEVASKAFFYPDVQQDRVARAFAVLSRKAGVYGMVGGQVVDVEEERSNMKGMTREKLDFIYQLKTGALIEASMMIGAILAGATEEEVAQIEKIAAKVGLAFQIQDDILDETSTFEELGKPIGSDKKNEKITYVTYRGLEQAKQDVKTLSEEAVTLLENFGKEDDFLKELFIFLISRNK